ncbi:hypothetical protein WR25_23833 [Diploscapter pachys]|uniref:Bicarbonate transporter-like transmembrane domain-containing protein n=1 Tax=Diploscapter pachys TaxID=2018661 RepID=A0A2A2J8L4_9BILA|nr:hypothetical protein WR25_23833 [Diploscapter pachys]
MLGGVIFAVFAGQPMVILATTTAMSIYIVIVRGFAVHADYPFSKFYSAVGVSASAILFLMSILGAPWFMKFARTSTEETMRVFQSTVRIYNALSAIYSAYKVFVHCWAGNDKGPMHINNLGSCTPTNTLIIFGLVLSATALGFFFNSLRESEYFLWNIRILISNYAIPLAILIPTFVVFFVIQRGHDIDHNPDLQFHWIEFYDLPAHAYSIAIPLGIPLAFVIFMDHILVTQNAENPTNQLTRHHRRHWDLTVLALINFLLSCFGLPWMTGAMPTTVLQVRALTKIYKDKVPKNKFARTYIGHLNPSTE